MNGSPNGEPEPEPMPDPFDIWLEERVLVSDWKQKNESNSEIGNAFIPTRTPFFVSKKIITPHYIGLARWFIWLKWRLKDETEEFSVRAFGKETGLGGGATLMPDEKEFFIKNKRVAKDRSKFKHW